VLQEVLNEFRSMYKKALFFVNFQSITWQLHRHDLPSILGRLAHYGFTGPFSMSIEK
jgi:hypothetical protein